ncbi:DUF3182 family protein [Pseudoxanthomonas composti]|uniref:DUF3182 family protein n=1 Tax=Pseudoxanthomonas composti TaxID=2137479 RepID=A0A4Q1JRH3_9GAMM|nr:DUF3182 family protein [Pseudoxanthomonas composti]RXQ99132.1 DUF3182 family protein [Pseudoxanthomonas composti]
MSVESSSAHAVIPLGLEQTERAPHEHASLMHFATRMAVLLGGRVDAQAQRGYFIPIETLTQEQAEAAGISEERQLFGGVVPMPFVATKLISHGLWPGGEGGAPQGWNPALGEALGEAVLPGYSVFTANDLQAAVEALLATGPVRCKLAHARGGNDQKVVTDAASLQAWMQALRAEDIAAGVVVEIDLFPADTFSVGCVRVPGHEIAYFGTQRNIRTPRGSTVYGGSQLRVVRGGLEALKSAQLPNGGEEAVRCVQRYEAAIEQAYPAMFASRRNYDLVRGRDGEGRLRCGVLEQSWRFGGASMAEMLAMEALAVQAPPASVDAWTYETYDSEPVPERAVVYFQGEVAGAGFLTKYAMVMPHGSQP